MPRPSTVSAPQPANPWEIDFGDQRLELLPSLPALLAIEATLGRSLYSIMRQVETEALGIREVAVILTAFAGAALVGEQGALSPAELDKLPHFAREFEIMRAGNFPVMLSISATPGMIVQRGVMAVTAAIVVPLAAALRGNVDAAGRPAASSSIEAQSNARRRRCSRTSPHDRRQ